MLPPVGAGLLISYFQQAELQTHDPSAFSELELDVQTLPLLNVSSQIVKVALMGALTFFGDQVVSLDSVTMFIRFEPKSNF